MRMFQDWDEGASQQCCALPKADVWSVLHQLQVAFSVTNCLGRWGSRCQCFSAW